jgi:hypothetical protein
MRGRKGKSGAKTALVEDGGSEGDFIEEDVDNVFEQAWRGEVRWPAVQPGPDERLIEV